MNNRWLILIGVVLTLLATVAGLYSLNQKAIAMVKAGRGHEVYLSVHLTPVSYNGFLIVEGAILLVSLLGLVLYVKEYLLERSLLKKYPKQARKP